MKLIKPSFKILDQVIPLRVPEDTPESYKERYLNEMFKHIELCGRTCYKSTDKITDGSAKPFVDRMVASKHYAMLEHGTIYLTFNHILEKDLVCKYTLDSFSQVHYGFGASTCCVTTNYRVIIENGWEDDLEYLCYPTPWHEKRETVLFICNRQVSHEFVRHRVFSFAQESTRYCNYAKDKFGNELTYIVPCWSKLEEGTYTLSSNLKFECDNSEVSVEICDSLLLDNLRSTEITYMRLLDRGWVPQQAATVLPNALKTELIMTGFTFDWQHFFDLRSDTASTGAPHPQAEELATPLREEFKKRGLI